MTGCFPKSKQYSDTIQHVDPGSPFPSSSCVLYVRKNCVPKVGSWKRFSQFLESVRMTEKTNLETSNQNIDRQAARSLSCRGSSSVRVESGSYSKFRADSFYSTLQDFVPGKIFLVRNSAVAHSSRKKMYQGTPPCVPGATCTRTEPEVLCERERRCPVEGEV